MSIVWNEQQFADSGDDILDLPQSLEKMIANERRRNPGVSDVAWDELDTINDELEMIDNVHQETLVTNSSRRMVLESRRDQLLRGAAPKREQSFDDDPDDIL